LLSALTYFILEFFFDTNCYWGLDKVLFLALLFVVGINLSVSKWFLFVKVALFVTVALISLLAGFFLKSADLIFVLFLLFGTRFLLLS